jgi:hypothetical protein
MNGTSNAFAAVGCIIAAVSLNINLAIADDTCGALESERQVINREIASLLENYPGTHVVIGLCGAAAKSEYDRSGDSTSAAATFGGCALIGCAMVGFDSCHRVALRWFNLSIRSDDINSRKQRLACS